jgi:hypothetical protein
MKEQNTVPSMYPHQHRAPHDEWLGPESHVPNLSGELRRRDRRAWGPVLPWLAGGLFVAGLILGGISTWLLARSRQTA